MVRESRPRGEAKPNLTPMIDMTFLLVVFFMLTIDLSRKEYVALELPYARMGVENKEMPRLTVNLLSSGDIVLKGKAWPLATGAPAEQRAALVALRSELQRLTADPALRRPDGSSRMPVMVHGDRDARWEYVQWILQVCADPTIGIHEVQFAVQRPPSEENR